MEFRVLGPLEVWADDEQLPLRGVRHHRVLAALLLSPNSVVSLERLIEAAWDDEPPATATKQIQNSVSTLRDRLGGTARGVIVTDAPGYRIVVGDDELDLLRFDRGIAEAQRLAAKGALREAVREIRTVVKLWRGPVLDGQSTPPIARRSARLAEQRFAACVSCADWQLTLGQHREVVDDLTEVIAEYPLRERPHAQLMIAFDRAGRAGEALMVFQRLRTVLAEELGIDPGAEVRALYERILRGENRVTSESTTISPSDDSIRSALEPATTTPQWLAGALEISRVSWDATPASPVRPMQLPPDVKDFTGRDTERAGLHRLLTQQPGPVVAITGKAGAGKTTLAVRVAYELGEHFLGGRLYVRLGGARSPRDPVIVVAELLVALGVPPHAIPEHPDARTALYRSQLAAQPVLVVLDDAADMAQIRPLLPGTADSAVLITSRVPLLDAHTVHLDVLDTSDAVRLLASIAGQARVDVEPEATAAVVRYCGNLPLALRIAGSRLVRRPNWTVAWLATRLADEGTRLNELRIDDLEARASLALSYTALPADLRRAFRLLSLLDTPDFPAWITGPLLELTGPDAQEILGALTDVHLIESVGRDRYRFHDLLRVYGREQANAHDTAVDRAEALERAFTAWLDLAARAAATLPNRFLKTHPQIRPTLLDEETTTALLTDPVRFLETERLALVAVVEQAFSLGMTTLGADTACTLTTLFDLRGHYEVWRYTHELALTTTTERHHQATLHQGLGALALHHDRLPAAEDHFAQARRIYTQINDQQGVAYANLGLGTVQMYRSDHENAATLLDRAMAGFQRSGDASGAAFAKQALGVVRRDQGQTSEATNCLHQALKSFRDLRCAYGQASVLFSLGLHHTAQGNLASGEHVLTESVKLFQAARCPRDEALALHVLAATHAQHGHTDQAATLMFQSLQVHSPPGHSATHAAMLYSRGWVAHHNHQPAESTHYLNQALSLFDELDMPKPHTTTRTTLHHLGLN